MNKMKKNHFSQFLRKWFFLFQKEVVKKVVFSKKSKKSPYNYVFDSDKETSSYKDTPFCIIFLCAPHLELPSQT